MSDLQKALLTFCVIGVICQTMALVILEDHVLTLQHGIDSAIAATMTGGE